jgi:hypothetical protein
MPVAQIMQINPSMINNWACYKRQEKRKADTMHLLQATVLTCISSSLKCCCFLLLDLLADSLFDSILQAKKTGFGVSYARSIRPANCTVVRAESALAGQLAASAYVMLRIVNNLTSG